jgi:glycosyltransferase involved in cell wall biosynthesis
MCWANKLKMPLLSVIVPNYKHARFLRQRLDSIFDQTFQDFEVILLDDCSTDDSRTILAEYAQRPQVSHYVANEKNSGSTFLQWKKGVDLAQGKYIWIAESDDWADARFLEEMIPMLAQNDCVAAFCRSHKVDQNGHGLGLWEDHLTTTLQSKENIYVLEKRAAIAKFMVHGNCIPNMSAVLLKKEAFVHLDDEVQTMRLNGDWLFWTKLLEQHNIVLLPRPMNHFRQQPNTARNRHTASGRNLLEYFGILEYLARKSYPSEMLKPVATQVVARTMARNWLGEIEEGIALSISNKGAKWNLSGINVFFRAFFIWSKQTLKNSLAKGNRRHKHL